MLRITTVTMTSNQNSAPQLTCQLGTALCFAGQKIQNFKRKQKGPPLNLKLQWISQVMCLEKVVIQLIGECSDKGMKNTPLFHVKTSQLALFGSNADLFL